MTPKIFRYSSSFLFAKAYTLFIHCFESLLLRFIPQRFSACMLSAGEIVRNCLSTLEDNIYVLKIISFFPPLRNVYISRWTSDYIFVNDGISAYITTIILRKLAKFIAFLSVPLCQIQQGVTYNFAGEKYTLCAYLHTALYSNISINLRWPTLQFFFFFFMIYGNWG